MIKNISCSIAAILLISSAFASDGPPRIFNTHEFPGLTSAHIDNFQDAILDYELTDKKGETIYFKNCIQVEMTAESSIQESQYSLFRLLTINCLALKLYANSSSAKKTFFPKRLTKKIVSAFPATAIPEVNDEDMKRRAGKTLSTYEKKGVISIAKDGNVQLVTPDDAIKYVVMARADFDGDGIEDLLIRATSNARNASGKGFALFLLSKKSASDAVALKRESN